MSGYHYEEKGAPGCSSCYQSTRYSDLKDTASTGCLPACMDRFSNERSAKDKWMYDKWVLGKNMPLPPPLTQASLRPRSNCSFDDSRCDQ